MLETQKKEIEELQDALKKYQSAEGQYHYLSYACV